MSTVDAAIINYITNGGSSGGGGGGGSGGGGESGGGGSSDVAQRLENEYGTVQINESGKKGCLLFNAKTRGVGLTLHHANELDTPFAIVADYGSNYPEFNIYSPVFELEATKNGQTGLHETTLRSTNFYTQGNLTVMEGYAFSAPNIYTKQDIDTMFETGGSKDEDTMTRVSTQDYYEGSAPDSGLYMYLRDFHKKYLKTGLIVKIKNIRSSEIESYVLIRKSDDIEKDVNEYTDPTVGNAILVSLSSNRVVPVAVGAYSGYQYAIRIYVATGTYTVGGEETGIFTIDHMSHSTLVKIACNYHTTYDQDV